uniref:translation initiation factor IF-2-like n=1 Tax=Euleptes europaea TaxID=460621 RepID=UPI002541A957|nr:translation initiation factor IF-2-like [Euleptes europaea]
MEHGKGHQYDKRLDNFFNESAYEVKMAPSSSVSDSPLGPRSKRRATQPRSEAAPRHRANPGWPPGLSQLSPPPRRLPRGGGGCASPRAPPTHAAPLKGQGPRSRPQTGSWRGAGPSTGSRAARGQTHGRAEDGRGTAEGERAAQRPSGQPAGGAPGGRGSLAAAGRLGTGGGPGLAEGASRPLLLAGAPSSPSGRLARAWGGRASQAPHTFRGRGRSVRCVLEVSAWEAALPRRPEQGGSGGSKDSAPPPPHPPPVNTPRDLFPTRERREAAPPDPSLAPAPGEGRGGRPRAKGRTPTPPQSHPAVPPAPSLPPSAWAGETDDARGGR